MISRLKQFSGKFRILSVFALVISFLVLGSCPLRKAVQALVDRSVDTERGALKQTNSLSSVVCVDSESSFINKMTLPERQVENKDFIINAFLLITFLSVWSLFKLDSQLFRVRNLRFGSLRSVPLYLRNNTFII